MDLRLLCTTVYLYAYDTGESGIEPKKGEKTPNCISFNCYALPRVETSWEMECLTIEALWVSV